MSTTFKFAVNLDDTQEIAYLTKLLRTEGSLPISDVPSEMRLHALDSLVKAVVLLEMYHTEVRNV